MHFGASSSLLTYTDEHNRTCLGGNFLALELCQELEIWENINVLALCLDILCCGTYYTGVVLVVIAIEDEKFILCHKLSELQQQKNVAIYKFYAKTLRKKGGTPFFKKEVKPYSNKQKIM